MVSERNQMPREHVFCAYIYTKFKKRLAELISVMEISTVIACKGGSDWRGTWETLKVMKML